jgi:hypothetical protein
VIRSVLKRKEADLYALPRQICHVTIENWQVNKLFLKLLNLQLYTDGDFQHVDIFVNINHLRYRY